jgi:membrane protein YqaA with SNARE-associated domain
MIQEFLSFLTYLVNNFSYIGIFLASLIANATILFPIPSHLIVFSSGLFLNPILVGISAGLGAAIGELTGYVVGRGASNILEKKKEFEKIKRKLGFLSRWMFFVVIIFAATPLPTDVVGIYYGSIRYSWWKFLVACIIGKILLFILIAETGAGVKLLF